MNRLLYVILVCLGCSQPQDSSETKKIIGANDFVVVQGDRSNVPLRLHGAVSSVGSLSNGCTVTHIGSGLGLTAAHCLQNVIDHFRVLYGTEEGAGCRHLDIRWRYRVGLNYVAGHCQRILKYELNEDVDYAVISLSNHPVARTEVSFERLWVDTEITVFSHPNSESLNWSRYCRVLESEVPAYSRTQFSHDCDTEPGSSGAPIIETATQKVVGIHNGAGVEFNYATFTSSNGLQDFLESYPQTLP